MNIKERLGRLQRRAFFFFPDGQRRVEEGQAKGLCDGISGQSEQNTPLRQKGRRRGDAGVKSPDPYNCQRSDKS